MWIKDEKCKSCYFFSNKYCMETETDCYSDSQTIEAFNALSFYPENSKIMKMNVFVEGKIGQWKPFHIHDRDGYTEILPYISLGKQDITMRNPDDHCEMTHISAKWRWSTSLRFKYEGGEILESVDQVEALFQLLCD